VTGDPLLRYAPLLAPGTAEDFAAACERPLPRVVWVNPVRAADPDAVAAMILRRCPEARPVPWWPRAFRLPADTTPGAWIEHRLGLIHVQEEATLWPAALLDLTPGDRVLDLCAAPGNKTAQIAVRLDDAGLVVANERTRGRLSQLRYNLERLGLTSVVVTRSDGNRFPIPERLFDHALVDAPCTCEGTTRKRGHRDTPDSLRRTLQSIQIGLLRRAIRAVGPGGTVVYATCTYAPEENERVLDAISPEEATIEPLTPPPGVTLAPGIPAWEGRQFRPDVVNAARLWPHLNDTGGFFVARLRRAPAADAAAGRPLGDHPVAAPVGWERLDRRPLLALWADYYGLPPDVFGALDFWRRTESDSLWAIHAGAAVPPSPVPETLGLRVRRGDKPDTQLANAFARRYCDGATRHVVRLADEAGIRAFFAAEVLPVAPPDGDGYYLALGPSGVLGRARAAYGVLRGEPSKSERTPPVL